MSGRDSPRPPTSRVSGVTDTWNGPSATAAVPAAVMRPSASWMAGCVAGIHGHDPRRAFAGAGQVHQPGARLG